nr:MAG TPA: hypothetical protein [Caudoviricetes sp.]
MRIPTKKLLTREKRISNISQQVAKFDCRTIVGHRFYY